MGGAGGLVGRARPPLQARSLRSRAAAAGLLTLLPGLPTLARGSLQPPMHPACRKTGCRSDSAHSPGHANAFATPPPARHPHRSLAPCAASTGGLVLRSLAEGGGYARWPLVLTTVHHAIRFTASPGERRERPSSKEMSRAK